MSGPENTIMVNSAKVLTPLAVGEKNHRWLVETPHGPTSRGKCKNCGASKQFLNFSEEILWDTPGNNIPGMHRRNRGQRKSGLNNKIDLG